MPKKIEEAKRNTPQSFAERLKREQMEFAQKKRQEGAEAVTTEVKKLINGWSDGQSTYNTRLAMFTGGPALVSLGLFVYGLYEWAITSTPSYGKLILGLAGFFVMLAIFKYGHKSESPKASFTGLKETLDVWLGGENK